MGAKYYPGVYASRDCRDTEVLQALRNARGAISEVRMRELDPPITVESEGIENCSRLLSFAAKVTDANNQAWQPRIGFTCGESQEVSTRRLEVPGCENEEEATQMAHRLTDEWLRAQDMVLSSKE